MDARALLTSQGWRGDGHSLHPTSDDTGLRHHILIKREGNDGRGLGHRNAASHQQSAWWMNAFDQALKGIDVDPQASGGLRQNAGAAKLDLDRITKRGADKYTGARGLYSTFRRGGLLSGTREVKASVGGEQREASTAEKTKKRKGALLTPPDSGVSTPATDVENKSETKEERRARRGERRRRKEKKKQVEEDLARQTETAKKIGAAVEVAMEARRDANIEAERRSRRKSEKEAERIKETKDERRIRKEARRARKEEKRRQRAAGS